MHSYVHKNGAVSQIVGRFYRSGTRELSFPFYRSFRSRVILERKRGAQRGSFHQRAMPRVSHVQRRERERETLFTRAIILARIIDCTVLSRTRCAPDNETSPSHSRVKSPRDVPNHLGTPPFEIASCKINCESSVLLTRDFSMFLDVTRKMWQILVIVNYHKADFL